MDLSISLRSPFFENFWKNKKMTPPVCSVGTYSFNGESSSGCHISTITHQKMFKCRIWFKNAFIYISTFPFFWELLKKIKKWHLQYALRAHIVSMVGHVLGVIFQQWHIRKCWNAGFGLRMDLSIPPRSIFFENFWKK